MVLELFGSHPGGLGETCSVLARAAGGQTSGTSSVPLLFPIPVANQLLLALIQGEKDSAAPCAVSHPVPTPPETCTWWFPGTGWFVKKNPDFLEPTQFILSEPGRHKALRSWGSFGIGWEGALTLSVLLGWVRLEELGGTAGCPCLWGHQRPPRPQFCSC